MKNISGMAHAAISVSPEDYVTLARWVGGDRTPNNDFRD
jgi:hypothetical protein